MRLKLKDVWVENVLEVIGDRDYIKEEMLLELLRKKFEKSEFFLSGIVHQLAHEGIIKFVGDGDYYTISIADQYKKKPTKEKKEMNEKKPIEFINNTNCGISESDLREWISDNLNFSVDAIDDILKWMVDEEILQEEINHVGFPKIITVSDKYKSKKETKEMNEKKPIEFAKIMLEKRENSIIMTVLEQNEKWRMKKPSFECEGTSMSLLFSGDYPGALWYENIRCLYLRGENRESDKEPSILHTYSNEKRDIFLEDAIKTLNAWYRSETDKKETPIDEIPIGFFADENIEVEVKDRDTGKWEKRYLFQNIGGRVGTWDDGDTAKQNGYNKSRTCFNKWCGIRLPKSPDHPKITTFDDGNTIIWEA